jgi:hypothetical protein
MGELFVPAGFGVLAYNFRLAGDQEGMTSTVGVAVGADDGVRQNVADTKADTWLQAFNANEMGAGWELAGCTLRMWDNKIYEAPRSKIGTGGAVTLPNNCAYLLKKQTNLAGRRGRGRMYIPPFFASEGEISQTGVITAGTRVAMENALRDGLPGADYVILHSADPAGVIVPPPPTPVIAFNLDGRVATQRRRLRR